MGLDLASGGSLLSIAMKPRNRQYLSLNVSSSRWMAYAVAGFAAASGAAAEGAIHYTDPANVIVRGNERATFLLDDLGDRLVFLHRHYFTHPPELWWAGFSLVGG